MFNNRRVFKVISIITTLFILLLASGCTKTTNSPESKNTVSGTFTGEGTGLGGPVKAEIVLEKGVIKSVKILSHKDTPGVSDKAYATLPNKIVETQSISVDTVSGATRSSEGIKGAVEAALVASGVDVEKYKVKSTQQAVKKESSRSEEANVVVIGAGAAGYMAALEASQSVDKVILLEKMPFAGGSSIRSLALMWSVDSKINKEYKVGLDRKGMEEHYETISHGNLNHPLLSNVLDISGPTVDKLLELGMPYSTEGFRVSNPEYPNLKVLQVNGGGKGLIENFDKMVKKNGVDVRLESKATELVMNGKEVAGVVVESNTETYTIKAKKVILASGGFDRNVEMLKKYTPTTDDFYPISGVGSTGDGINMALKAGAQLTGNGVLGNVKVMKVIKEETKSADMSSVPNGALYINLYGKRFTNEAGFYSKVARAISEQPQKLAYTIHDSSNQTTVALLEKAVTDGIGIKADSIDELGSKLGMDIKNLTSTINEYNKAKEAGTDPGFGLKNAQMLPAVKAPFYAFRISPITIGTITGLKVNENCQVLDAQGNVIPNLLAAGEIMIGNLLDDTYSSTGSSIANDIYTGRIAAQKAIDQLKK